MILHFNYKYDDFDASKWKWYSPKGPGIHPHSRSGHMVRLALVLAGVLLESAGTVEVRGECPRRFGRSRDSSRSWSSLRLAAWLRRGLLKRNYFGTPEAWHASPFRRLRWKSLRTPFPLTMDFAARTCIGRP